MSARHLRSRALLHDHLAVRLVPAVTEPGLDPAVGLREALSELCASWRVYEVEEHPLAEEDEAVLTLEVGFRFEVRLTEEQVRERREAVERRLAALRWDAESGDPPPPGVDLLALLEQDVWWCPKEGGPRRLIDLGVRHRAALLAWLERYAASLKNAAENEFMHVIAGIGGEAAGDDAGDEMERLLEQSPVHWMATRPLYARLRRLVQADRDAGVSRGPGRTEGGGDGV